MLAPDRCHGSDDAVRSAKWFHRHVSPSIATYSISVDPNGGDSPSVFDVLCGEKWFHQHASVTIARFAMSVDSNVLPWPICRRLQHATQNGFTATEAPCSEHPQDQASQILLWPLRVRSVFVASMQVAPVVSSVVAEENECKSGESGRYVKISEPDNLHILQSA